MRVILQVESGSRSGHKLLIVGGQSLEIGRSHLVDLCLADDARMSGRHFRIINDGSSCQIQDLGSTNGTHINGHRVTQAAVGDNDLVVAGETQFRVRISPQEQQRASAGPVATTASISTAMRRTTAPGKLQGDFQVQPCPSGLISCRGQVDQIPAEQLAAAVSREFPLYLLIDFQKLGIPFPEGIGPPSYLFDWLGEQVASQMSPHLLAAAEFEGWTSCLQQGWGKDGVVCVFSRHDKAQVLECLRSIARGASDDRAAAGIVGICWPRTAEPWLRASPDKIIDGLFQEVNAVLLESSEDPSIWELFGSGEVPALLERLGLRVDSVEPGNRA